MRFIITPAKRIAGTIKMPGDKSISHRAIMLGSIARGRTVVKEILDCDDCNFTIHAFRAMGIPIKRSGDITTIIGKGLRGLSKPKGAIYVGQSGTTMRVLAGILSGQDFGATITGDRGLLKRPMRRIVRPLSMMNVKIAARSGGYPPLVIKGGEIEPINYTMPIPSAQVKSAILFAALYADGVTRIEERYKSRDHTERMMKFFGARLNTRGLKVSVEGGHELKARALTIPGDISSASFFMVGAAILKGSKIRIEALGINPTRTGILDCLRRMGANVKIVNRSDKFEPIGDVVIESSGTKGIVIERREIPRLIDELPIIFVLAALSCGRTVIKGIEELRVKETDRVASMKYNLNKMGARFSVIAGDVVIDGVRVLKGAPGLKSFGDHRTCMAMAIAALAANGKSEIDDVNCIAKSFPGFFNVLLKLRKY